MKTPFLAILLLVISFSACERGPEGPQGPQGNANVQSVTLSIPANQWYHIGTSGVPGERWETSQIISILTQDIVNTGAVNVYVSGNGTLWTALPYTYPTGTGSANYSESWIFSYQLNNLVLDMQDSDFFTQAPTSTVFVKVVAVASAGRKANPDLDWTNYSAVKAAFDLKD